MKFQQAWSFLFLTFSFKVHAQAVITYKEVAPIISQKCLSCHGAIPMGAPFSLDTYEALMSHAEAVRTSVQTRNMPPFAVDNTGACGTYGNITSLSDKEIQVISDWVTTGKKPGTPDNLPPPQLSNRLEHVDATPMMMEPYTPGNMDEYRCFVLNPVTTTDRFISGYNVIPGNPDVVHHVILYIPTERGQRLAEQLDAQDPKPGYSCFGSALTEAAPVVASALGTSATLFPQNTGIKIPANRKVILQVHYGHSHQVTQKSSAGPDQTKVQLQLETSVNKEAEIVLPGQIRNFTIPPKQERYPFIKSWAVANSGALFRPFDLYGVLPHMHMYGKDIRFSVTRARTTANSCLMDVPRWNFNRQHLYFYQTPISINDGDEIKITCAYNTMRSSVPIPFGDSSSEEMCLVGLYLVWK
ncbi:MAG: hypothetical protein AB7F59_07785 [Bdellovibrionales bacterium]